MPPRRSWVLLRRLVSITSAAAVAASGTAFAQSASSGSEQPVQQRLQSAAPRAVERQGQATQAEGGPTAEAAVGSRESVAARPQPFGASLFTGRVESATNAANRNYRIQPGDQIAIQTWGGANAQTVQVVDPTGNIVLPDVGPIHVAGVPESDLQRTIQEKASRTFTSNVNLYAVLLTTHRVGVFVTGFVEHPGHYSGAATDSVLDYLVRAGGIDPSRGSYREITVIKAAADGKPARRIPIDLYNFLITGEMPDVQLDEGDTIVVAPQGAMVEVDGAVRNNYLFEIAPGPDAGQQIVEYSRPLPSATDAIVVGTRAGQPYSAYLPMGQFERAALSDQDKVTFVTDAPPKTIRVQIQGSRIGPSVFVVPDTTTIEQLLPRVRVEPSLADVADTYILRKSVAEQQARVIAEARDRLEQSLYLAVSPTTGVSQIRASEAQLIRSYLQQARTIHPDGRLVISDGAGNFADNFRLEDGDVVVIPKRTQLVMVSGEVLAPQAEVFERGQKVGDYVAKAGGYSERGRRGHYLIRHANGAIDLDKNAAIRPGDEIVILPYIDPKHFQLASDVLSLLYQAAVSANVFNLLK